MSHPPHRQPLKDKEPLLAFERKVWGQGFKRIAGVDEAGRGPLAGPVVAAACVIAQGTFFPDVNDSKLLTPRKRQHLFEVLTTSPTVSYGIGVVDAPLIDEINILQATIRAMHLALASLPLPPDYLLTDAVKLSFHALPQENLIHGDRLSHSIAAASILAKVTRDHLMLSYHNDFPLYGFDRHKGYGTAAHLKALAQHGPCPLHRRSFH